MVKDLAPNVPFIEAHRKGGKQRPTAIVLRSSFTTSEKGAAMGIANNWHVKTSPALSTHYVVDEAETYQCVPDKIVSYYGAQDPKGALSITICSEPLEYEAFWDDAIHAKVLDRVADLVAQLALAYRIPVRYLDGGGTYHWNKWKRRARGGIIVRVDGAWPMNAFLADVQHKASKRKEQMR